MAIRTGDDEASQGYSAGSAVKAAAEHSQKSRSKSKKGTPLALLPAYWLGMRLFWMVVLPLIAGVLTSSIAQGADQEENIVIGLLLPLDKAEAASLGDGVKLAVEQANSNSAVKAGVVMRGTTSQWGADAEEAARMVLDDGAIGMVAPFDGAASHLVLQVAGRTAIPVVSLCGDSSVSRTGVPWMVRVAPRTIEEAEALFKGLALQRGPWVALVPNGRAGREIAGDLRRAAKSGNGSLAKVLEVDAAQTNAATVVAQVMDSHAEAVLLWLSTELAGTMARKLRGAGFAGILAGPSRLQSAALIAAAGEAAEGLVAPGLRSDQAGEARYRAFESAFQKRFGHEPDYAAVMSYDAAGLLLQVLRPRGETPTRPFTSDASWPGLTGRLTFDGEGNRQVLLRLLKVRQGRFVPLEDERKQKSQH